MAEKSNPHMAATAELLRDRPVTHTGPEACASLRALWRRVGGHSLLGGLLNLDGRRVSLLPSRKSEAPPRRKSGRTASGKTRRGSRPFRLLHAEDDALVSDALRELLEAEGWTVEVCADGATALERLSGEEHYDLLLLDDGLPRVDGLSVLRRVRKMVHRRRLPVVMLSGGRRQTQAIAAGADAFLRKPEDVPLIIETIARLLGERSGPG